MPSARAKRRERQPRARRRPSSASRSRRSPRICRSPSRKYAASRVTKSASASSIRCSARASSRSPSPARSPCSSRRAAACSCSRRKAARRRRQARATQAVRSLEHGRRQAASARPDAAEDDTLGWLGPVDRARRRRGRRRRDLVQCRRAARGRRGDRHDRDRSRTHDRRARGETAAIARSSSCATATTREVAGADPALRGRARSARRSRGATTAVTVRVERDGRAEVFAFAIAATPTKLGAFRLAPEHEPITTAAAGTDHADRSRALATRSSAGADWTPARRDRSRHAARASGRSSSAPTPITRGRRRGRRRLARARRKAQAVRRSTAWTRELSRIN